MREYHRLTHSALDAERTLHADLHRAVTDAMPPIVVRVRGDSSDLAAALESAPSIDVPSRIWHPAPRAQRGRFRRALARLARRGL